MSKPLQAGLGFLVVLLLAGAAAPAAQAQATQETVVTMNYLNLNPEQTGAWVGLFKKHFQAPLDEAKQEGLLRAWHLFVPGIHHPGYTWTHVLAIAYKDRAAQGVVQKKLEEIVAAMPAADSKQFYGAIDREKHFDDEWREIDFATVTVPEEKKE